MKKLISLLLVLCMVLGMSVSVFADGTSASVSNNEELAKAIEDGKTELTLSAGTYHMPAAAKAKTLTITGASAESVIIEVVPAGQGEAGGQLDYNLDGSNVTFNNVTIKTNSQLYAGYARLSATYNNCVIQNTYNLGTGNSAFYNCTFNITNEYLRVGGAHTAVFDNCTFNTVGRAILVFQDGSSVAQTVTVRNCTFNATAAAYTWDNKHVSAVSIDGTNGTYVVNLEGTNTVDSDFNGLWQIKTGDANVTVNVKELTPTPDPVPTPTPDNTDDEWYGEIEEDDETESLVVRIKFKGVDEADFEEIKVNLLKNGKKYDSEELSASKVSKKDWRFEWDNLDEDDDWSVALAAELEGYDAEVVNLRGNYWTITLTPAKVEAPVVSVDKANPETGASDFVGVAAALAVVSVLGGAALSLKK